MTDRKAEFISKVSGDMSNEALTLITKKLAKLGIEDEQIVAGILIETFCTIATELIDFLLTVTNLDLDYVMKNSNDVFWRQMEDNRAKMLETLKRN